MNKEKYLGILLVANVTFQLISDVTAGKIVELFSFPVSVTVLYFPIVYIISDILTEVYGYARARQVLLYTLFASVVAGIVYQVVAAIPPFYAFGANDAYTTVLSVVPRVLLGGWVAVFFGDVVNNYVLAKMKVWQQGRHLWMRTIGSTIAGQFVNTTLFYGIALSGVLPLNVLFVSILSAWVLKVGIEILLTPVTYMVIKEIKKREGINHYDRNTDFNPFSLKG